MMIDTSSNKNQNLKNNQPQNELELLQQSCKEYSIKNSELTFQCLELEKEPKIVDLGRYQWLKTLCQQLSREQRTVDIIDALLEMILCRSDAISVKDNPEELFSCIHMKFILVNDLAISCKLTVENLLRHASHKVYSNITYFLIMSENVLWLISNTLCGIQFYKEHMLPRSWFHLLIENDLELLTNDSIKILLNYKDNQGNKLMSTTTTKRQLFFLISKISSTNKLNLSQKRNVLQIIKRVFGLESEQELASLYNSNQSAGNSVKSALWFESMCLMSLMEKLGLSRKYFMEQLLVEAEQQKVKRHYHIELFWECAFFKKMNSEDQNLKKQNEKIIGALEFISKYLKKDASTNSSDFSVCFLVTFNMIFPKFFNLKYPAVFRQNILYQFINMVDLLLSKQIYAGFDCIQILEQALIQKVIYVLRIAQHEDTVDMSIYSLQILLNQIKLNKIFPIFPQVFSLITHAFISFSHRPKIGRYVSKIFEYYISNLKSKTDRFWPDIQFIMLEKVSAKHQKIRSVVETVAAYIYSSADEIENSIRKLLRQISRSCEDIRILAVKYILDILEQKNSDNIRKVLCRPDMLKNVYQCILELKQSNASQKSEDFGVVCGKVVAFIGLCHPFVNDPVLLKANNQQTIKQTSENEEMKSDEKITAAQSERVNPLTNMKYNLTQVDNTLELLAVPSLSKLPLDRENPVLFAQKLKDIISEMTQLNEEKPKNYFFAQFLLARFIKNNGGDEKKKNARGDQIMNDPMELAHINQQPDQEHNNQKETKRIDFLANSLNRLSGITRINETPQTLVSYKESPHLHQLALYLISKIEDPQWQQIFESCIPLVKKSLDVVELVLPYLTYFTIRSQKEDDSVLADQISNYLNDILGSKCTVHMSLILQMIEFLKIAIKQDKLSFKTYLEQETKFRYNEKLFFLEFSNQKIQNADIQSFVDALNQNIPIKKTFLSAKKLEKLISKIDRQLRNQAAKQVQNLKRCIFNMEDTYRQTIQQSPNMGFMDDMPAEDVIEIVRIQKQLMPEDFDSTLFNQIIRSEKKSLMPYQLFNQLKAVFGTEGAQSQDGVSTLKQSLQILFQNDQAIKFWKHGNWQDLSNWLGDFDLRDIVRLRKKLPFLLQLEAEDKKHEFELILSLIFAEYYRATQFLLQINEFSKEDPSFQNYMVSLDKIKQFIDFLYFEFMFTLEAQQGETGVFYKLFLHVLYEIETAIYFIKDLFYKESDRISEHLKREVNRDKRKFEKLYYEKDLSMDLNNHFEKLLGWFQERSAPIKTTNESMRLITHVRLVIFQLYDRENESAIYLMQLAKLSRKQNQDVITENRLFKECSKLESKIVDFEYEYAKYILKTKNAHEAYQYLHGKLDTIKSKADMMQKMVGAAWMPKLVYEKAQLFELELLIKIDPRNPKIFEIFSQFVKQIEDVKWEKPNFVFAQYIDMLERNTLSLPKLDESRGQNDADDKFREERNRRQIQRIYYYMRSIQHGHKYIWQSFPRALELWFDYNKDSQNNGKITTFMKQELKKLDFYKIATVLHLLLSRFGHERKEVRDTIVEVLALFAVNYPEHSAWWILHFHFFEDKNKSTANTNSSNQNQLGKHAITRSDFSKDLFNKMITIDKNAANTIMKSESLFGDLKKLAEKETKQNETKMEMTRSIQEISSTNLVMPIEENLTPQLPPLNFQGEKQLRALVQTSLPINQHNPQNLIVPLQVNQAQDMKFPAYKSNPIKIQSFLPKVDIMSSKERPKKIGIVGTDGKTYNFLLKCDKQGDLRKEQRFIDFAMLCNKMLHQDSQARQRGLRLRTYSIVPLSRHTGLIEWIQNTSTLKIVVNDQWKRVNIKGEMGDIKKLAQSLQKGETHNQCWPEVKKLVKPVLAAWFAEHFPSPDIWYEARVNFVKTCAIWSMIGYVIGLGDRHGDNILIHQHTGEITHVDFDCIFEKGAKLKVPEIVPFRLTANIIDAFGIFKEKGIFQKSSEVVLRVLRKNQKNIISYLDSFKHDPLIENQNNIRIEIKDALEVIERKLQGNISIGSGAALTVEEQVDQVILNAINDDSLSRMYIGWMPWL